MSESFAGYRQESFVFEDKKAYLVYPNVPATGKWAIYTEYFGAFPNTAVALLERGYMVAGLENTTRWGGADDPARRVRFADFLEREKGLAHRCVPIGMSCGGLQAIKFAAHAPDRVSVLYLDAPVVNLLSCPLYLGDGERDEELEQECLRALGKTPSQMLSYRDHPLDHIPTLIAHRIPVVLVYGDSDPVVPYHENGALLEAAYRAAGVPIVTYGKAGCAHHPHGLEDPAPIVEYILANDR